MGTKNTAKDYEFWLNGREYPVELFGQDLDYDKIDATDSSTASDGKEFTAGRGKRAVKIDAFLYKAEGSELATGTLTANTKYLVTLGTITEGAKTYAVGTIFISDGTGTATSSNKVKPLGATVNGKTIACTVAAATVPVTNLKFSLKYDENDATDSSSSADLKEFVLGRGERTSTIEMIQTKEDADLLSSAPTAKAVVFTFDTGVTISGNAVFTKKGGLTASSKSDLVKVSYDLSWVGVPTLTGLNLIPANTPGTTKLVYAKGASTDKAYSGTGVISGYDISADSTKGENIKVNYTLLFNGTVTETVAN